MNKAPLKLIDLSSLKIQHNYQRLKNFFITNSQGVRK